MTIKIESSREFRPELLDEFKTNPQAIDDMSKHVAKNAATIAAEAFECAIGPSEEYLKKSNLTLKVSVEFGNTTDLTNNLSDRLTPEERIKVINLYSALWRGLGYCHEDCVVDALESLEDLFGKELTEDRVM